MNLPFARFALHCLTAVGYVKKPHRCEQFVREVAQAHFVQQYSEFWSDTARNTGLRFKNSEYAVPLEQGSVPGDLLFKLNGSGGDGHVGIRIEGNRVAENSSVHWNGTDARGTRSMKEFGHFDVIVRLT